MNRPARLFAAALALTLSALATRARADDPPSPTLSISAPSTKLVDINTMSVSLAYNLTGGAYQGAEIVFVVPAGALYVSSTFSTITFTHSESPAGTHRWTTANPFDAPNTGTGGTIGVEIKLPTWTTLAGRVFKWDADLAGPYTPTGGSATTLAIDAADVTTTATSDAVFGLWNAELRFQSWVTHPTLGPGLQFTYDLRPYVEKYQPLAEGYEYEFLLGAKLYFLRAWPDWRSNDRDPPGDGTLIVDDKPADLSTTGGGRVHAYRPAATPPASNDLTGASNSDYSYAHAPHLYVDVFIPCTDIPVDNTAFSTSPDYHLTITAKGQLRTAAGLGPVQTATRANVEASGAVLGLGCFQGGGLVKHSTSTYGENRWDGFYTYVDPPKAAQPIEGMIVDVLPLVGWTDLSFATSPSFTGYFCVLPGVTAFSLATFKSTYLGTSCTTTKPVIPTTTTHIVSYASAWGSGAGISTAGLEVQFYLPLGFSLPGPSRVYTNTAYFEGLAELDPQQPGLETIGDHDLATTPFTTAIDRFQGTATHTIVATSWPGTQKFTDHTAHPRVINPGSYRQVTFRYYIDGNSSPAINPHVSIDVPDGVILEHPLGGDPIGSTIANGGYLCDPAPLPAQVTSPAALDRPLQWQFGDATVPYYLRYFCIYTAFWFRLDDAYPHIDDTELDFVASITALNSATPPSAPEIVTFEVSVPPEMQVEVKPACQQTPIGDEYPPAFVVSTRNTGGAPLTNVSTTFRVPRADVDGGVGGAVFGGVEGIGPLPDGAFFEVWTDGGSSWSTDLGPNPAVTHVRLGTFSLAPFAEPVAFFVRLSTSASPGDTVVGRATVASAQIGFVDSGPSEAFIAGSCHELTVTKFFDYNGDGLRNGTDVALAGVGFTVDNGGVVIASGTTGSDGAWSVIVPAASYHVTEQIPAAPASADPVFHPTTPRGAPNVTQAVTISVGDEGVAFGNNCTCADTDGNRCTYAECHLDPSLGGGTAPSVDDVMCLADNSATCEPQSACGGASCNPGNGECSYTGPTCAAVDFFIPVRGADGEVVGNARCVLARGAAPICDMSAGRLRVYPLDDPTSNSCGLVGSEPPR